MTDIETIQRRIKMREGFGDYHEKIRAFRRILSGDYSDITGKRKQTAQYEGLQENKPINPGADESKRAEVQVHEFEQFRTNDIIKGIKNLVMYSMATRPEVGFEGIPLDIAILQAKYIEERFFGSPPIGCDLHPEIINVQMDALVAGCGILAGDLRPCNHTSGKFMVPGARYIDVARCWWDPIQTPRRSKWFVMEIKQRASWYHDQFGDGCIAKALEKSGSGIGRKIKDDDVVRGFIYCDREGEAGTYCALVASGDNDAHKAPLLHADSPFYREVQGYRQPFLPVKTLSYYHMPGAAQPLSLVETAIRHQLDLWTAEAHIRDALQKRHYTLINEAAINHEDLANMIDPAGEDLEFVRIKDGLAMANAVSIQGGAEISPAVLTSLNRSQQELIAQIGYNPFMLGSAPSSDFATQAAAINEQSGATGQWILKNNAAFYADTIQMLLDMAVIYDDAPITIRDEDVVYEHGRDADYGPISLYLRPDVPVQVREETLQFQGRDSRRNDAANRLATLAPYSAAYPRMLEELIKDVLQADGIADIDKYLERPLPTEGDPALIGSEGAQAAPI